MGWVYQAVRDAAYHRQGVLVYGNKGTGRSEALDVAAADFRAREERRARRPGYVSRDVRVIPPMRPQTRADLIRELYSAEMSVVPWRVGRGGEDFMLAQLVAGWQEDRVAALLFDETDHFGTGALDACRDIIAVSGAAARAAATGGLQGVDRALPAGPSGHRTRPPARGIGVVLLGLPSVYDRLRASDDWGNRWRKAYPIVGLSVGILPDVYRRVLPACDAYAAADPTAWAEFIRTKVAPLIDGAIRRVHAHLWEYVALCEQDCDPVPRHLRDVPFDPDRFLDAVRAMAGSEHWNRIDEDDA